MPSLSGLYIYPIKSLGGISLDTSEVQERGLKFDRRFLLVDENGIFITQRTVPQLVLLQLSFSEKGFKILNTLDNTFAFIPFESKSTEMVKVRIWNDICNVVTINKETDLWFSNFLNKKCSLVFMPESERRVVEKQYLTREHIVSFADAYPFLIIGQPSLDDLNIKLQYQLPINRFRPNLVFTGCQPYDEDNWKEFIIGNVHFEAVKPCARCIITTTDQETSGRAEEPLKTLSKYRSLGNKVYFGMNAICKNTGVISISDRIKLL